MLKFTLALVAFLSEATLTGVHAQVTSQELVARAQKELLAHLKQHHYSKLELSPKTKAINKTLSLSQLKIQIKDRYPPLKQICVRLSDDKYSIAFWFKINAYQKVLVAKQSLKSRSLINANHFTMTNQNIAGLNSSPYQQLPTQTWLKKPINKGAVLTEEYLSTKPDIINGQSVQVHIKSPGISINTEAIAQHDAYVGQAIKIKNVRSNKLFIAVVTRTNEVEVRA